MNTLLVFFIVIILISIIGVRYRVPPFMTLVGGAIAFGLAVGVTPDKAFEQVAMGCASVFNSLGIPILAGSVIAKYLAEQGYISQIVSDIKRFLKKPTSLSAFAGYLIGIPSTCPITAFMILSPVVSHLAPPGRKQSILLYLVALGSAIGVAFVYPTPVTFPLFDTFAPKNLSPLTFDLVAIPLSVFFVLLLVLYAGRKMKEPDETVVNSPVESGNDNQREGASWGLDENSSEDTQTTVEECDSEPEASCQARFHPRAWAPFFIIFAAIPVGFFILHLSHFTLVQFIMFAGMIASVCVALPENRWTGFVSGAKHAGVIIFDICGAGALGYAITQSTFASDALAVLAHNLPLILIPFVLAALIQTAQGSRIVTSILTAQIIGQTMIPAMMNPLALFLMIIAGAGVICFVTDPYFWMLHRTTGDDVKTVLKNYTLPQVLIGCATYLVAFTIQNFWP